MPKDLIDTSDWPLKAATAEIFLAYDDDDPVAFAEITKLKTGTSKDTDDQKWVYVAYTAYEPRKPKFGLKERLVETGTGSRWFPRKEFVDQMEIYLDGDAAKMRDRRNRLLGRKIPSYLSYGFVTTHTP